MSNSPIIVTLGVIGTFIKLFIDYNQRKNRKPPFEQFQRHKDNVGAWYIFVHSPTTSVMHCNATFKGKELLRRDGKGYEINIPSGGGCNFDMPKDVSDTDNGFVIIRDGKKKLVKERFNKMIPVGI